MTNYTVLAEMASEHVVLPPVLLLAGLKMSHGHLCLNIPGELAECPIICNKNTTADDLIYTQTNYLCVKNCDQFSGLLTRRQKSETPYPDSNFS